jgi:nitroimidazol reductase NimA-like FMN-containing flavoprotein (pyridoxamine 5'-phosphate oxidase superfamily)
MQRKEREMSRTDTEQFLSESKVGRLGVCSNSEPYIVPVLFVYDKENEEIFFHCAKKGKKTDVLRTNPKVCFETDEMSSLVFNKSPCGSSLLYRSVIAFGEATFIEDAEEKAEALNVLMKKYAGEKEADLITPERTVNTQVIKIRITSKTGKTNDKA